jgi:deoxycytidine triphosphate deaminase
MRAIEFTTELGKQPVVRIPQDVAARLPKSGLARVIVLTPDDPEDAQWRGGAYEQFVREEAPEDAVYDSY